MEKEKRIWFILLVVFGFTMLFTTNCKKDVDSPDNPTNGETTAVFNSGLVYGTMTDQDGNTYKTITIGTQTWMAENLRTTKYRNGETIPEVADSIAWGNLKTGAYCNNVNCNNDIKMIATYGRLYNWYTVSDSRNIAPSGWHVATLEDLMKLTDYLGGSNVAGGKLKEVGTTHWSLSIDATNETGFTALPGGYHHSNGYFHPFGYYGYFWSATEMNASEAGEWALYYNGGNVGNYSNPKVFGCSVRCVKD